MISEFINYTIKGISGFTNVISYKSLVNWNLLGVLSILVPVAIIYGWVKSVVFEKCKEIYFLTVYGLATFVICFPISNEIHFLIGSLISIIGLIFIIYMISKKIYDKIRWKSK